MTENEIRQQIIVAIQEIAPEVDGETLDANADLREACDLDSIDFLNLVIAIKQIYGVEIAEKDYANVFSLSSMAQYLLAKTH